MYDLEYNTRGIEESVRGIALCFMVDRFAPGPESSTIKAEPKKVFLHFAAREEDSFLSASTQLNNTLIRDPVNPRTK